MTFSLPEQDKKMGMDNILAEYFGNNVKIASAAEQTPPEPVESTEAEKVAQVELFQKLASDQGIDLEKLSTEQVEFLWNQTFSKTAGEEPSAEEKSKESGGEQDERKEEAKKEHEEKKEAAAKFAEATFLGKVMAHSLVAEMRELAKTAAQVEAPETEEPTGENKEAAMPPQLAAALGKGKDLAGKAGKAVSGAADKAGKGLENAGKKVTEKATGVGTSNMKPSHAKGVAAGIGGAAAGAAAGAAFAAKGKKKESSIDSLALEAAVKIASESGYDAEEAANRVLGVHHLGMLGESEKVASATDADHAVFIRGLEFLEAAGYPVNWEG